MCHNKEPVILDDKAGAAAQPVIKKVNGNCCGRCRIEGKSPGPATGNGQNENREGDQMLSEVME